VRIRTQVGHSGASKKITRSPRRRGRAASLAFRGRAPSRS
jgi:hypothetical protein